MPKTLEEGEEFGKGENMFDFPCLSKNKGSGDSDSEMEPYDKRKESLTVGLEHGNGSAHAIASVSRHEMVDGNSNSCSQ